MKEITRLDLGNNDITELPPRLGLLSTIKFLRFEGNMIKGIKATKTSDVLELLKNRIPLNELQGILLLLLLLLLLIFFFFLLINIFKNLFYFILFFIIFLY